MRNFILIAVCVFASITATCQSKPKPVNTKFLIDSLDRALFNMYIFPDKSKLMGDYLKSQLTKGVYKSITDPKQLATQLEKDIQHAHRDGHLRVYYDPEFAKQLSAPRPMQRMGVDSTILKREQSDNFGFSKIEILEGNIGYVQFSRFASMVNEAKPVISAAFRFLSNTEAIIIDLRRNGGGSPFMVRHIASYFVKERTRLNDIYDRRVDKTMEFWADPNEADNLKLSMPVYILTSSGTFSAAEDLTYAMQINKRAVIVGDTTGGGAHPTTPVYVGQDFVIYIPFARSINHITKTDWEGTGVRPDVPTNDDALVKAKEVILVKKIENTKDEEQKRSLQWLLHASHVKQEYGSEFTNELLKTYTGKYGRFEVIIKDNALYVREYADTYTLKPISNNHFLGDDWFQAEFLSTDGKVNQMKMTGKAGWVAVYERE